MTKPRAKLKNRFHVFVIEPEVGFEPNNWRQTPSTYRILEYVGAYQFRGTADAEKFLFNHDAIETKQPRRWAICLDLTKSVFESMGLQDSKPKPQHAMDRFASLKR